MKIIVAFTLIALAGCASGKGARNQTAPQIGYAKDGGVQNISSQNDAIVGSSNVTITNNYQGFSKEQLEEMLEIRDKQIESLKNQVDDLQSQAGPAKFKIEDQKIEHLNNGKFKAIINLVPIGENVIPNFTIAVGTKNGAVIESLRVTGESFRGISMVESGHNEDKTVVRETYKMVDPKDTTITITTNKDPGGLEVFIDPLQK